MYVHRHGRLTIACDGCYQPTSGPVLEEPQVLGDTLIIRHYHDEACMARDAEREAAREQARAGRGG